MTDRLDEIIFYQKAKTLWDDCWNGSNTISKDFRGMEIGRQLIRSVGSISANIEEGYGRKNGKEYAHFLRISRGSARESKGWYTRAGKLLKEEIIINRVNLLDEIIAMLNKSILTLENKQ